MHTHTYTNRMWDKLKVVLEMFAYIRRHETFMVYMLYYDD